MDFSQMNSFIMRQLTLVGILGVFGVVETAAAGNFCNMSISGLKQFLLPDAATMRIRCANETYQRDVRTVTCKNGELSCKLVCPAEDHILIIGGLTADKQSYHNDTIEFFPESPCMSRILPSPLNTPRSHASAFPRIYDSDTTLIYVAGGRATSNGSIIDPVTEVYNVNATNAVWQISASPNLAGNQDAVWASYVMTNFRGCGTFDGVLKCIKLQLDSDDVGDVQVASGAGLPTIPSCSTIDAVGDIWMFGSKNNSAYTNKIIRYDSYHGHYITQTVTLENLNDCGVVWVGSKWYVCGNNDSNTAATLCQKCSTDPGYFQCEALPNLNRKRASPAVVGANGGIYAIFGGDDSIEFLDYFNETKWQLVEDFPKFGNRWHAAVTWIRGYSSFFED